MGRADLQADGRARSRPGRRARSARHRPGRASRHREPEQRPPHDVVLRHQRVGTHPRADQLPTERRRGGVHRRALRRVGVARRSRARRVALGASTREVSVSSSVPRPTTRCSRSISEPEPWTPDEDATATINYTSGTTARPKGVQLTHRNIWVNATTFGWHTGVTDRDVYLHTLPMFHCNGWGMPYAVTGMGGQNIVLRKVDGGEILRRVDEHGVTLLCGAPAVVAMTLDAAANWDGPIPGAGRTRMVVAGAPPPTRTIERIETELGWEFIQIYGLTETSPFLVMNRSRAEFDDLTPSERAARLEPRGCARDRHRDGRRRRRRGARARQRGARGVLGSARGHRGGDRRRVVPHRRWRQHRRRGLRHDLRPQEGRDHQRRRERVVDRGRGRAVLASGGRRGRGHRRARREVGRDGRWRSWCSRPAQSATEQELIDHCRSKLAHFKCPRKIDFRDELARTATGKLQKFKLRAPYWEGRDRQVN